MNCMRCGVEITSGAVFCDACLADMETHPVKPGTPVNLPRREKQQPVKRSKKRVHKPDEVIGILRRWVIWLMAIVLTLAIALSATIYLLVSQSNANDRDAQPGQNYGTSARES